MGNSRTLTALATCLVLLLLTFATAARRDRSDAFIGYKERDSEIECKDALGDVVCSSYKEAGMCNTGYIKSSCKRSCAAC